MRLGDQLPANDVDEGRLDLHHFGEVREHRTSQQVELLGIRVARRLPGLVVDAPCLVPIDDEQVSDAAPPHALVEEAAGFVTPVSLAHTQLELGVLVARDSSEALYHRADVSKLLGDRRAVLDEQLCRFVDGGAVVSRFSGLVLYVLSHLEVEVLLRALLEGLDG